MNLTAVGDVQRIAEIPDPIVRNLNITQCYYELSRAMEDIIGINPNWCTFAVWASKQAGQSIRREDLIRTFEYYFRHSPEVKFALENISVIESLKNIPDVKNIIDSIVKALDAEKIFDATAEAVAKGNKKVFEEIGKEFARFLGFFKNESDFTRVKINEYCSVLKTGDPPDGQRMLYDAFSAYYEAKFISDSKAKAEIIYYANLLIGFHEQTRLQPEIAAAMNASLFNTDDLRYKIFKNFLPGTWLHIRYFLSRVFKIKFPLDDLLDQLTDLAKRYAHEVITRFMMSLYIPESPVLRLGEDLKKVFPDKLISISNEKLKQLLVRIDPTPDSLSESGAKDWGNFEDRIHFISDFFRCYYDHLALFNTPFSDEQSTILKQGKRPSGSL